MLNLGKGVKTSKEKVTGKDDLTHLLVCALLFLVSV